MLIVSVFISLLILSDKEQLLEIAKANAAAMCAKAGMAIPDSLRPRAILQLPFAGSNTASLPLPLSLSGTLNAAVASMTAATMTAAISGMSALSGLSQFAPLPSITNKPPPMAAHNPVSVEEAKRKLAKEANNYTIKELTEVCLTT